MTDIGVLGPATERSPDTGGPDMVQLLNPEGERVDTHPGVRRRRRRPDRRGPARVLPRPGPHPALRRRGHRAAAPGRARPVGSACSARRPPRSAPAAPCARRTTPSRPTASTASPGAAASTRSTCSACSAASTTAAGTPTRRTSTSTRSSSAPRPCTPPATRWACSATAASAPATPTATPPSSPTSATAPPARATSTRRSSSPRVNNSPGRLLLPEQPVGHLRAQREADPHPALPARPRLRLPRRPGRRQRRARRVRRDQGRARRTPAPARARRSSRPSPTGWARTPPPTTRPSTASPPRSRCGSARPDRAAQGLLAHEGTADAAFFDADRRGGRRASARSVRERCLAMPDPPGTESMFDHVYAEPHPLHRSASGAEFVAYQAALRGGALMAATDHRQGHQRAACAPPWRSDPKVVLMGEDIGKLGGVFRVTEGLQKDFGEDRVIDTPLAEAGIVGTAIGMALRGYRPVVEIQFDGFVYPAFDHIVSQVAKLRARSLGARRDADGHPHPVRRRHRRGRAPQRVQRGLLRAHRRPAGRRLLQPPRRALDDPAGHRDRRPGRLLRAQAPLLGQG